ncbi:hypothetical protein ACFYLX_08770 [Pseudarthrobacter enclensis]|uniref:hypothetical protein n=1 Tax=Pseudarthrobacter enclensis TaxID=993070 RepID=UPI0036CD8177
MAVMKSGIEGDPAVERTNVHPVQVQALRIIDDVLSDPDPELADVRESLRGHIARNPNRPAPALLLHLMDTRLSEP